ncbi:hypothetical protein PV328_011533 [Microctonus aethiopoides]|uniref:Peptidase S1 domain-containing protein n=1 Tax=Microctonus aethiopoides TaxID=144406 RepID=A0AA39F0D5_9HYME|nr:hypothetical protein PV328_011533 [Microctonus aethiopoides]
MIAHYFLIGIIVQGCLAIEPRVINGQSAKPHEFPHHVAIFVRKFPLTPEFLVCGGSIISPEWILTAGNCVQKIGSMSVKAGKHYIDINETYQQNRRVIKSIVHEDFTGPNFSRKIISRNNIALLKLQSPLVYTDYIKPIALPYYGKENSGYGEFCGWGVTSTDLIPSFAKQLQKAEMEIIDNESCAALINSGFLGNSLLEFDIHGGQMCTLYSSQDAGPCFVDSGSAFIQYNQTNLITTTSEIVGIFTWTRVPCGKYRGPAVYTRVSEFIYWIKNNMEKE